MFFSLHLTMAIGVIACGGSSTNTVPVKTSTPASTFSVAAASNTFCVPVSAVAQTVALPPTGGFTGSITVGPVAATSATCVPFTFSTGADVIAQSTVRAATEGKRQPLFCSGIIQTVCAQLTPIAQVLEGAIGATTVPNISVTLSTASLGTQLGSQFSALSCIADATDGVDTADQTLGITEQGITATFGPIGADQGLSFSAVVVKYALTALCGINIPLPTISPSSSPSPSPSPAASPSPTASPTVAPTSSPTPASVSAAACSTMPYLTKCGTVTVSGVLDGGPNAGEAVTPAPQQVSYTGLSPGTYIGIPAYFAGSVTIAIPNMYPGMQQYVQVTTCPSTILAQSGVDGDTYTLTLPANGQAINLPATGDSTQSGCSFAVTNVPPGAFASIESGFYIDYGSP